MLRGISSASGLAPPYRGLKIQSSESPSQWIRLSGHASGCYRPRSTAAVRYWAAYPDEVDAEIAADAAEEAAEQAGKSPDQAVRVTGRQAPGSDALVRVVAA